MPRTSIKGQVLADLVAKFAEPPIEVVAKEQNMDEKSVVIISTPGPPCWKVYVNGVANQRGFEVGVSPNISRKNHHREVLETWVLGHEQQSRV